MLKKITLLFLFIGIFSLQAERNIPKFSDFNNLIQEAYDRFSQSVDAYLMMPNTVKLLPSITNKLIQGRLMLLSAKISLRAMTGGVTVLVFYNNVQQIESLKKCFYDWNWNYLIVADMHKTEQEIKDIFNITTEPTIIYYEGSKEIARSNNFDINDISQHINTSFVHNRNTHQFCELKNLIQETYNTNIENIMDEKYCGLKILPKNPITQELTQLRFSIFLEALHERGTFEDIAAVVFYNNAEQIEPLKTFKKNKTAYLITADISKIEQEIISAFKITKPIIIYYKRGKEVARNTNFDVKNILQFIKQNSN